MSTEAHSRGGRVGRVGVRCRVGRAVEDSSARSSTPSATISPSVSARGGSAVAMRATLLQPPLLPPPLQLLLPLSLLLLLLLLMLM